MNKAKSLFIGAIRAMLIFTLVFSGALHAEYALAVGEGGSDVVSVDAATGTGDGTGQASDAASSSNGDNTGQQTSATVDGIELQVIQTTGQRTYVSDSYSDPGSCSISAKGGSIQFGSRITWNDDSINDDYYFVQWKLLDDAGIARLSSGMLTATGTGDGTVTVQAILPAQYSSTGKDQVAQATVAITGQTDAPYVESIQILDPEGNVVTSSYSIDGDLSTAYVNFGARVTVMDPATGGETVYDCTAQSGLAAQSGGMLSDLAWDVDDSSSGAVSTTGTYRPLTYNMNMVRCSSLAGQDGTRVMASVSVIMNGADQPDGYHPQDSLRVYVEYEADPGTVVSDKTFSVEEVEALGCQTVTYTGVQGAGSTGGYGFYTVTGYGPYLADVLKAAGIEYIDSIKSLEFESYDSPDRLSPGLVFDTNRYYFPNYSLNRSHADAVQVAPMIATQSSRSGAGDDGPSYDFSDGNRFYLLYGATMSDDNNAQHQRKWINAIHVVLSGAPPVQPDDSDDPNGNGDSAGEGASESNADNGQGGSDNGNGSGSSDSIGVGGSASGDGSDGSDASDNAGNASGGSSASDAESEAGSADAGAGAESDGQSAGSGSKWSIYQMVNPFENDVDQIDQDNPLEPYVLPAFLGVLAAGAVEYLIRYRRQMRAPAPGFSFADGAAGISATSGTAA